MSKSEFLRVHVFANPTSGNAICYLQMQTFCSNISWLPMPETAQYVKLSGALSVSQHCLTITTLRTERVWAYRGWGLASWHTKEEALPSFFPTLGVRINENPETEQRPTGGHEFQAGHSDYATSYFTQTEVRIWSGQFFVTCCKFVWVRATHSWPPVVFRPR